MTDTDTILEAVRDESRRSFMKKGAIAAGGLALGGSATAAANTNVQQDASSALVFTYSYFPGRQFQVIANLQQDVVDQVLGRQIQGEPVISDTADFNAYIGNYQTSQGGGPGEYFLLFTQETGLQQGQQYMFDTGASFFSTQFNLLEASLTSAGGGGGGGGGGGNQTAGGNQTVGGGETAGGATNGNGGAGDTGGAGGDDT